MDVGGSIKKEYGTGFGRRGFCKVCVLVGAAQTWNLGARWSKKSMPIIAPGLVAYLYVPSSAHA